MMWSKGALRKAIGPKLIGISAKKRLFGNSFVLHLYSLSIGCVAFRMLCDIAIDTVVKMLNMM